MLDVKLIPQNQIINLVVLNHWCYTGPNKSEYKFCCNKPISRGCSHNGNYYSSGMNAASVSKIINQRSNIAGVEKHLWLPVTICNHVNISTQNQTQKVRTHLEPVPELRQGIWGPFSPQASQKIDFCPAWSIAHCSILFFKRSKLH